jgi:hypothetical protein
MVDLQRPIRGIWNIVCDRMQGSHKNSDGDAPADSVLSEKFSGPESSENFIRADLS